MSPPASAPSALGRFRLLDLSRQLPGPFCSTLLGDLGMDVLVIAAPDDPFGLGVPFLARNKRSMTLNLKSDAGRDIFRRLVAEADVVLEGFRPGVTARLGIDYESLRTTNPRLVYCSISGYGQDGPYRDRVGHDVNYLAYAGVLGYIAQDGVPVIPGVQIADIGGGALMAAVGILAALIARGETGPGQQVDIAMLDGSVAWNVYHVLLHLLAGRRPPERDETQLTGRYPCYAVYETRDGRHLTIGAYEGHFWANLCRYFGREDFIAAQWDEARRDEMFRFFRAAFRERTLAEWRQALGEQEICFGPVNTLEEVFVDPQVRHRGMVVQTVTGGEPSLTLGVAVKLSGTPGGLRTPPAAFGEHTDQVLGGFGFTPAEIAALRERGVV